MRYGLVVEEKEVLAVVLSDVEEALTQSVREVKTILTGTYGKTCQKYFLRQTSTSTSIQRGKNDEPRAPHIRTIDIRFCIYLSFEPPAAIILMCIYIYNCYHSNVYL